MYGQTRTLRAAILLAVMSELLAAQGPATELVIDIENVVHYAADLSDITKFARNPAITPGVSLGLLPTQTPNFMLSTNIGDIVRVNGQPAKGLFASRARGMGTTTTPTAGRVIADVVRAAMREDIFEILQPDGTPIGSIMIFGFSGGAAPPGQPSTQNGNWAIVGGTGAFMGARGQAVEDVSRNITGRGASMAEDPAFRRVHGGGTRRFILQVIPLHTPQVLPTRNGLAVVHSSDFAPLSAARPAKAGEILSVFMSGLGPTVPAVPPGQPFPSVPLAVVSSPVVVSFNGKPTEVLAAVGSPFAVNGYQVNFRIPQDAPKGEADIEITVAWVASTPRISIMVE
jgi:hypothetical protein